MAENKKENPTIPEYVKDILGIPRYEETPRKSEISYDPQSFMTFSYNFQNDSKALEGSLYKIAEQFSDSDFFDTETGKKMIEADGALRESSPLQSKNPNSPGCSSWVPCTRKKVRQIPRLLYDVNTSRNQDSDVGISQYMLKYSESLGDSLLTIFEPGSSATIYSSTPVKRRISLLSCNLETQTKDKLDFSNVTFRGISFKSFNISNKNNSFFSIRNTPKTLQYATPIMEKYKQYIGSSNYKQLKRLEAAEAEKNALLSESPMDSLRFLTPATVDPTDVCLERSTSEWLLQPHHVTLDSTKAARVQLINRSDKRLKFHSSCDGKIVNVCPLCGVIPARNQIGLRIVISRALRFLKDSENMEDEVKIFVGNTVKIIHLIVNVKQTKSVPERKFITY